MERLQELTLADLFHIPYGSLLVPMGCDLLTNDQRPNLVRWWKDISSRESWKKLVKNKGFIEGTA